MTQTSNGFVWCGTGIDLHFEAPQMLILDTFRGHIMDRAKKVVLSPVCELVIMTGGLTRIFFVC